MAKLQLLLALGASLTGQALSLVLDFGGAADSVGPAGPEFLVQPAAGVADSLRAMLGDAEDALEHVADELRPHKGVLDRPIDLSDHSILDILDWTIKQPKSAKTLPLRTFAWVANRTRIIEELEDDDDDLSPVKKQHVQSYWSYLESAEKEGTEYSILITHDQAYKRHRRHRHGLDHQDVLDAWLGSEDEAPYAGSGASWNPLLLDTPFLDPDATDLDEPKELPPKLRLGLAKLVTLGLTYHTIHNATSLNVLANRVTWPTFLPSFIPSPSKNTETVGPPHRLRFSTSAIERGSPNLKRGVDVNFYASVVRRSVKAKNGYIHFIDAPLAPPLSPHRELLLYPSVFSTLTSSTQQVGLSKALVPKDRYFTDAQEDGSEMGMINEVLDELTSELNGQWTVFAPSNRAFNLAGVKTNAFLHSPGPVARTLLTAGLAYHIVPQIIFHSDLLWFDPVLRSRLVSEQVNVPASSDNAIWAAVREADWADLTEDRPELAPFFPQGGLQVLDQIEHELENEMAPGNINISVFNLPSLLHVPKENSFGPGTLEEANKDHVTVNLTVAAVAYHKYLNKGPIARRVLVRSYLGTASDGEEEYAWVPSTVSDIPVRGGAVHILPRILKPGVKLEWPKHGHHEL